MTFRISSLRRWAALGVALAALFAGAFGPTALAHASRTVGLSGSARTDGQAATGAGFALRGSEVRLWSQAVSSSATLEHQSNIATSHPLCYKPRGGLLWRCVAGGRRFCYRPRGGLLWRCVGSGQLPAHGVEGDITPDPTYY